MADNSFISIRRKRQHLFIKSTLTTVPIQSVVNLDLVAHCSIKIEEEGRVNNLYLNIDNQKTNLGPVPGNYTPPDIFSSGTKLFSKRIYGTTLTAIGIIALTSWYLSKPIQTTTPITQTQSTYTPQTTTANEPVPLSADEWLSQ